MRIELDSGAIKRNYNKAKEFCSNSGVSCSVMVKDFYGGLGIQNIVDAKFWSNRVIKGGINYIVGSSEVGFNSGGIVLSHKDAVRLAKDAKDRKVNFVMYIPVNLVDNREGLTLYDAIALHSYAKGLENGFFRVGGAVITSGCMDDNVPSFMQLSAVVDTLKKVGFDLVSVGGSYYLGWIIDNKLPLGIDDMRIGEYVIYGTVPFYPIHSNNKGEPAIKVRLEIIAVYKERREVLLLGGSSKIDIDKSICLSGNFEFRNKSTEYTIMSYKSEPKVGEFVKFVPDYHSLIKLLGKTKIDVVG